VIRQFILDSLTDNCAARGRMPMRNQFADGQLDRIALVCGGPCFSKPWVSGLHRCDNGLALAFLVL
jgi:hypothetical protein